jgi:hypothetical protein
VGRLQQACTNNPSNSHQADKQQPGNQPSFHDASPEAIVVLTQIALPLPLDIKSLFPILSFGGARHVKTLSF